VTISTTRQFLVLDIGAHSATRTTSPSLHVVGVVGVQLGRAADVLAVQRVLDLALDQHGDRLVHLVADDAAFDRALQLLGLFRSSSASLLLAAEQGVDASDLAAHAAGFVGLRQLAGGLLHAQRELLLAQLDQVGLQLVRRLLDGVA
jgi:hypothetical protein